MPPNTEEVPYLGSLGFEHGFTQGKVSGYRWLDRKRETDGAEGLWRIHDDIYDLTDFVGRHPGGAQWLELTKGTDITEAFEAHHIMETAENMLPKFQVRKATTPRNSPFTFEENGFYRTLKKNIRPEVRNLSKRKVNLSNIYTDTFFVGTVLLSIAAARSWSYTMGILAALFMCCLTIASHNYFHKRNNWRMYYFNLSMLSYREWRISHALSHHLFTNTIADMEITTFQPIVELFSKQKSFIQRYLSWFYWPLSWPIFFQLSFVDRTINYLRTKDGIYFEKADVISFILPSLMYLFGGQDILPTIGMWCFVVSVASFIFLLIGVNAAHHHPEIFHEGDTPRKERDWGICQLDALMDRVEITGSHFLVLSSFGDHGLHHLFPTLDHGTLNDLYPVFKDTMKKFNIDLRMTTLLELFKGHFLQLAKNKPNPNPPNLLQKNINAKLF